MAGAGPAAEVSAVEVEQMPLRGSLASSSVADEASSPSGRLARVRGAGRPASREQGMHELLLQFGVVACELDQALFQFAGFFFQAQLEAFHPMDPVVDVIAFQVVKIGA